MNSEPRLRVSQFFRRLASRGRSRRFLVGLAGFILVVSCIYIEEDWRGNQAWERYRQGLLAKGEIVDWNAYIPDPVPEEQNVFRAPRMSEWFAATYRSLHNPATNEFARSFQNSKTTKNIVDRDEAADYLEWSDRFEPQFEMMRIAFARPSAQLVGDYRQPLTIPVINLPSIRIVVLTLSQRARCHLLLGQADKAFRDLDLLLNLGRLVPDRPTGKPMVIDTYAIWVKRGIAAHSANVFRLGLASHAWQEPQLLKIEKRLRNIDFIGLQAESCKMVRTLETTTSLEFVRQVGVAEDRFTNFWQRAKEPPNLFFCLAPKGWVKLYLIHLGNRFQTAAEVLTASQPIVAPSRIAPIATHFFGGQEMPQLFFDQTIVNEMRVACALECYYLAHQEFPESLDEITPEFIPTVPHDLIGGQPLKYRRDKDGKFLLYSVGWKGTDDGGISSPTIDPQNKKEGDWVW